MYLESRQFGKFLLVVVAFLSLSWWAGHAAGISKWVDANGKTHYGSQPPADAQVQTVKKPASVAAPAQAEQAEITLYSTAWCGYCKKARAYLQRNNIAFTEKDIEKSASANREHKALGGRGVPLLVRNGKETRAGFSQAGYDRFFRSQ